MAKETYYMTKETYSYSGYTGIPEARCRVVWLKGSRRVRGVMLMHSMSRPRCSHRMCRKKQNSSKTRLYSRDKCSASGMIR